MADSAPGPGPKESVANPATSRHFPLIRTRSATTYYVHRETAPTHCSTYYSLSMHVCRYSNRGLRARCSKLMYVLVGGSVRTDEGTSSREIGWFLIDATMTTITTTVREGPREERQASKQNASEKVRKIKRKMVTWSCLLESCYSTRR